MAEQRGSNQGYFFAERNYRVPSSRGLAVCRGERAEQKGTPPRGRGPGLAKGRAAYACVFRRMSPSPASARPSSPSVAGSGTVDVPRAAKLIDHDPLDVPLQLMPVPWMQLPFPVHTP